MIDPKHITPLLSGMKVRRQIGKGPSADVYLVTRDNKKMAVKHISIPASDAKTKALIYSGAVKNEREAQKYYSNVVADLKTELLNYNKVKTSANIQKFVAYQLDQKILGIGYDLYLLSAYNQNLIDYLEKPITKVNAVNLGIDLATALQELRAAGLLHKDVHPGNIFAVSGQHFALGDLGIAEISDLAYSSLPDSMITAFTAPEVLAVDATLSQTMDIYSVGVILYMIYNGNEFPLDDGGHFKNSAEAELPAPKYADQAMTEIILKACAFNPADRYQDPSELKDALILYAQRGDVSDDYLVPQPEPEVPAPAAAPAAVSAEPAAEAPVQKASPVEASEATPAESAEGQPAAELPAEEAAPAENAESSAPVAADDTIVIPDLNEAEKKKAAKKRQKKPVVVRPAPELLTSPDAPAKDTVGALGQLSGDDLIMPANGEVSLEDFLSSMRRKNSVVYAMDESGNKTMIPEMNTPENDNSEYIDSADSESTEPEDDYSFDTQAQETPIGTIPAGIHLPADVLMEDPIAPATPTAPEAPVVPVMPVTPVVQPEELNMDMNMNNNNANSQSQNIDDIVNAVSAHINAETVTPSEPYVSQPASNIPADHPKHQAPAPAQPKSRKRKANVMEYDEPEDEDEDDEDDEDDEESGSGTWKKVLIAIIVLLVLAGGAFGLYTFKTDTINSISAEASSSTSITVSADTKNGSAMDVICSTPAGEVSSVPLEDGVASFTDLNPNTTYTFTLSSDAGKFLLGNKSSTAKTNQMTNLNGFGVISYSPVSATLSLSGTGPQPDTWILTITSDSGESRTEEVTGTQFEITDLTPETNYTVEIAKGDGDILGGTTTTTFTTQEYTILSSFEETAITTDSISLAWEITGTVPDTWTVTCEGSDGSTATQEVSGTEYTFTGLNTGVIYTMSLATASLYPTDDSTIEVTIPSITITSVTSEADDDGNIKVEWEYTGDTKPSEWHLTYTYADNVEPTEITSDTNSITLKDLIPDTSYKICVTEADSVEVGGDGSTICSTGKAEDYTEYGCNNASLSLYVLEDNEDELTTSTTTFKTDQHIAFAIEVSYDETEEDKTASTLYVIRNADGVPVHVYESSRTWSGTWTTARHTGDIPDTIDTAGDYTFEVYFDGCFMASESFTVE